MEKWKYFESGNGKVEMVSRNGKVVLTPKMKIIPKVEIENKRGSYYNFEIVCVIPPKI